MRASPASTAGRDAAGLAVTSVFGAVLNALKLVLLTALCSAHELDLITAGLLVAVTGAQLSGEPLANFAVIRDRGRTRARLGAILPAIFVAAAAFPDTVLSAVAPGLDVSASDVEALRLFCLAGAAMVVLWWAAGEAQRHLDFRGIKAVNIAPNAAIVVALALPTGDRTEAVAIGLMLGAAIAAAVVAAGARGPVPRILPPLLARPMPGARGSALPSLLLLALASQANLIALRVVASFLPAGSVSAVYIATGIVLVPTAVVATSLSASLLPRWAAGEASGWLARPGVAAAASGALTAALVLPLLVGFLVVRGLPSVKAGVDPDILAGLSVAIPIMAAGAVLHGAAWVARGYAVAHGAIWSISALAAIGALLVPLAYVVEPTLAGISVGFVLSAVPWLAAIPLARKRARSVHAVGSDRVSRMLQAARTLGVDATTGEVVAALNNAGCRSLVMKGPAFQRELYRDGTRRDYWDTDLLVHETDLQCAAAVLDSLGFDLVMDHREHEGIEEPHAQEWRRRGSGASVDLHWRIPGAAADSDRTWEAASARTEPLVVGGTDAETLDRAGTALLVGLHAAHHGRTRDKPLADLERALDQFELGIWAAAARLAEDVDATEALAAGLALTPAGRDMAATLQLPPVRSPHRRLMATTQRPGALAVLRILDASGARARVRAARLFLFPAPAFMRAVSPLARRGKTGLALSYCGRIAARTWQLPGAVRAVRAARRTS